MWVLATISDPDVPHSRTELLPPPPPHACHGDDGCLWSTQGSQPHQPVLTRHLPQYAPPVLLLAIINERVHAVLRLAATIPPIPGTRGAPVALEASLTLTLPGQQEGTLLWRQTQQAVVGESGLHNRARQSHQGAATHGSKTGTYELVWHFTNARGTSGRPCR